jgi:uncharacterized repeat protein (TIGR01451 family)
LNQIARNKLRRVRSRPVRSFVGIMTCVFLVTAGMTVFGVASAPTPVAALPGTPGITQPGKLVYSEDFSSVSAAAAPIPIGSYVGGAAAQNEQYYADPAWSPGAQACNGWILRQGTPLPANGGALNIRNNDQCGRNIAFTVLGNMAFAMGKYQGMSDAQAAQNQILSEYTNSTNEAQSAGVQLQTTRNTVPTIAGHFYAVSGIFGETNCFSNHARMEFSILVNGAATVVGSNLDPCSDPSAQSTSGFSVAKLQSGAIQVPVSGTTPTLGIRVWNTQATGNGNDVGFDLPQLVDVTPQLDKAFTPATITQGQTTTLSYTVTNTSDLAAKNGWHFIDTLPSGLTASGPVGGTCVRTASSVSGQTVDITGNLAAGSASCTITVSVTSNTPGTYSNSGCTANDGTAIPNCTNNFPTITGLNPPGTARLTVLPVVDLSITKDDNLNSYIPGSPITYTVTVHNNGPSDAINAVFTDPLPASIQGATWTCAVTAAGAPTLPPTGPTVCSSGGSGSITDTVRINTGGTITYTISGIIAASATGSIANTATVKPAAQTPVPNMPGGGPIPVPGSTTPVQVIDGNCPPSPDVGCSASVTTPDSPEWSIKKTAEVDGVASTDQTAAPGQTITYTVAATNTRGQIDGVILTDNLADVLDDATFVSGSAVLAIGTASSIPVADPVAPSTTLKTPAFTLSAGQIATLTYKVIVNDDAWNADLVNVVTGEGSTLPTNCVNGGSSGIGPECTTTHHTPAWLFIMKLGESSDATWVPMDGSSWAIHADEAGSPGALLTNNPAVPDPGQTGRFQVEGIQPGTYWLEETAAPDGFNLLAEPVQFTVNPDGSVTLGQGAAEGVVEAGPIADSGMSTIYVRDVPALELPESGGSGTTPFLIGGSLLLIASMLLASGRLRRTRSRSTTA